MSYSGSDLESLRDAERECLRRFNARATRLVAQSGGRLTMDIARGKAIEQMPKTCRRYEEVRQRLVAAMARPLQFHEV